MNGKKKRIVCCFKYGTPKYRKIQTVLVLNNPLLCAFKATTVLQFLNYVI